ncbi:snare associated Golgi protein-domain-containing protein [Coniella lustricola]|uniref:Golgi apparatus membrane protein TVP38 n=1 Tax=Coniella lustricola TaxID=2025994 RepID=A0A2T2ZYE0_9PEZI|nr:snare associated Golgi protein-domain-containing protein [Coniella lustricola]
MGDYNAFKRNPSEIELDAGSERAAATTKEFAKLESGPDDDEPETNYVSVDWRRLILTPKYLVLWVVLILVGVFTAVISLKHDQVVAALRPFAEKCRDIPAGWLIFVAILFVISFPPLFGHELVALLAGVVYGLWEGFGVVAFGTFIGEIGTWFAFKKVFRKKAEKMERTNLTYGALAKMCRDGGFWIVFVIRLSVVPSHMSTAVFSTCDVKFWHFVVSTFFTLPKQLILVYLGVLLVGGQSETYVKYAMFGVAGLVTLGTGIWIWYRMAGIKKELLDAQAKRKERRALKRNNSYGAENGGNGIANNNDSSSSMSGDHEASGTMPLWQREENDMTMALGGGAAATGAGGYGYAVSSQDPSPMPYEAYRPATRQQSPPVYEGGYAVPQTPTQQRSYTGGNSTSYGTTGRYAAYPGPSGRPYRAEDGDLGTYNQRYDEPESYDSPPQSKPAETRGFI